MQWDTLSLLHVRAVNDDRQRGQRQRASLRALGDVERDAGWSPDRRTASAPLRSVSLPPTGGCDSRPAPSRARPDPRTA